MSQSATLYSADQADFLRISHKPDSFIALSDRLKYVVFDQSFEGLRFVLSKNRETQKVALINQIFYPGKFVGNELDLDNVDFDQLPDDFDFSSTAIHYHDFQDVEVIAAFLLKIDVEEFQRSFDPEELNENNIYTSAWNHEEGTDRACNQQHIVEDFLKLKELFNAANTNKDYVLSFVG